MTDDILILESSIRFLSSSVGSPRSEKKNGSEVDCDSSLSQHHSDVDGDERLCERDECCETISHL